MNPPIKRRYGFLNELHDRLGRISSPEKILVYFLRRAVNFFDADSGALWLHDRVTDGLRREASIGARDAFDEGVVRLFLQNRRPEVPHGVVLAPLVVNGRARGVVGVRRRGNP